MLDKKSIENGTDSLNHSNIDHRANMTNSTLIMNINILFKVGLETSIEDTLSNIINDGVFGHVSHFLLLF